MAILQSWRRYAASVSGLLALVASQLCSASDVVTLFGPGDLVVFGAIVAMPSAGACVLAEAILPRRRLPLWLTAGTAVAAVVAIALALRGSDPIASPSTRSSLVSAWLLAPPLATLALRGAVSEGLLRLALGWVVALATLALLRARHVSSDISELTIAGAASCLTFWTTAVLILKMRGIAPDGAVDFSQRYAAISSVIVDIPLFRRTGSLAEGQSVRLRPAQKGLIWWFAGACVLYFGIGAAISAGKLGGGGWLYVEWQYVADFFGIRYPKQFRPAHAWWVYGLPWSLFAGSAFWGLAGLLGGFDPGSARIVRFAAIVFGGALMLWSASIITEMADVNAREEQASGIHR